MDSLKTKLDLIPNCDHHLVQVLKNQQETINAMLRHSKYMEEKLQQV